MTSAEVIPTNHTCTNCGAETIKATLMVASVACEGYTMTRWILLDPDWEHGGNIEVRASEYGRLFARNVGTSPEEKRLIEHECDANLLADALFRDEATGAISPMELRKHLDKLGL